MADKTETDKTGKKRVLAEQRLRLTTMDINAEIVPAFEQWGLICELETQIRESALQKENKGDGANDNQS